MDDHRTSPRGGALRCTAALTIATIAALAVWGVAAPVAGVDLVAARSASTRCRSRWRRSPRAARHC